MISASMVMVNPADGKKYKIITGKHADPHNFPNPADGYTCATNDCCKSHFDISVTHC